MQSGDLATGKQQIPNQQAGAKKNNGHPANRITPDAGSKMPRRE